MYAIYGLIQDIQQQNNNDKIRLLFIKIKNVI